MERAPAVAGMFYPANAGKLERELEDIFPSEVREKCRAKGIISPHAGYVYSGAVAAETIASVHVPNLVLLIGPNHTGLGLNAAVMSEGEWCLPTGKVKINTPFAERILDSSSLFTRDSVAHMREHSIEVQLPLLLHERPDLSFVPLAIKRFSLDDCRNAGTAIARAIKDSGSDVLIVASSDMTHYESQSSASRKDRLAIEAIISMDPEELYIVVADERISMCGIIPSAVMMYAAIELGAKKAELVRYATSGDVSGDYERVVGYAGIVVS